MNYRLLLSFILLLTIKNVGAESTLDVVVSIKPIHSIVTILMDGIATPKLLLNSSDSAHTFHLKPSQIRMLSNSDLVITISDDFETGLRKALKNVKKDSHFKVSSLNQLNTLKSRGEEIYEVNEEEEEEGNHADHTNDLHLWLDVDNMQLISQHISNLLIELDPANESKYSENFNKVNSKLTKLKIELQHQLKLFLSTRFVIFADTLQYFENSLNLKRPVIITPYHGARLSINRTLEAKKIIKDLNISCLIYGTEIRPNQVNVLSEGLTLKSFKIDILGAVYPSGSDQYFNLMKGISSQLALCLK
jgi:zinc transport system substrate-binding protein